MGNQWSEAEKATRTRSASKQAFRYLQASIIGTLCNFASRFLFAEYVGFALSVILSTYVGMIIVFLLSYRRAFGVSKATGGMIGRFVLVSHVGMLTVWLGSMGLFWLAGSLFPVSFQSDSVSVFFSVCGLPEELSVLAGRLAPRLMEGTCHAGGIVIGFFVNFWGHRLYSFARERA